MRILVAITFYTYLLIDIMLFMESFINFLKTSMQ